MAVHAPAVRRIPNAVFIALIALAGLIAYANSFAGQFVWDDKLLIEANAHVKSLAHLGEIFRSDLFHMTESVTGYFRPAQVLSYMVDYAFWGKMPFGYHVTSLILQVVNAALVFYLGLLITGDRPKSFIVGMIFCIHPAFVPVVGYIAGRADLLGMLFGLGAVYLVLRHILRPASPVPVYAAVVLYACAIISKEYYLFMPVFIALFLASFRDRRPDKTVKTALIAMCAVAAAYLILRATALNFHQKMGVIADQPFLTRLAIFPWVMANYVGVLVMPVSLSMEKVLSYGSLGEARFVVAYIVPAAVAGVLYYLYGRKDRERFFWLAWWTLATVPFLHLFMPLKAIWADHWSYFPSVGFFFFIASFFPPPAAATQGGTFARRCGAAAACVAVVCFIAVTVQENRYWRDEETLFARILLKNPKSARTIYNTGKLYEEQGDWAKALDYYNRAIEGSGGSNAQYFNSRGMVHKNLNDREKARADFEMAVSIEPAVALYHNNLGCIYGELNMTEKARAEWNTALRLNPKDEFAKQNLQILEKGQ